MSVEQLEQQLHKAEQRRLASEREITASIRIKESIEAMEQRISNIEHSLNNLTRKLTVFLNQQNALAQLEKETFKKLQKNLDGWR